MRHFALELIVDGCKLARRIGRARHLAADDDVIRAIAHGFGRRRDTLLIARIGATGPDAGRDQDRVLAGSDDGFVYCFRARDGVLLWKQRIGPGPRRIFAGGRTPRVGIRTGV